MHRRRSDGDVPCATIILHKGHQKANVRQSLLRFAAQTRVAGQLRGAIGVHYDGYDRASGVRRSHNAKDGATG